MRKIVADLCDDRPVWAAPEWLFDGIREALPAGWELEVVNAPADGRGDGGAASAAALAAVRGAEIYLGYGMPEPLFRAATEPAGGELRWVHSAAAGVGGTLHPPMREAERVVLTNSAGIHAEPIAETVMAMVLYFARGLDLAAAGQRERRWHKEPFESADTPVREAAGASLGIVGLGGIGQAVAAKAQALGLRVQAVRRSSAPGPPGVGLLKGDDALERLLRTSDYLVLAAPETSETRGMIGAREIALMPPRAVLINISRGSLVDEAALAAALESGGLRGAGLDVFATEPLPSGSPFWKMHNVLVMPHVSGTSRSFWRREAELITANIRRYMDGAPLTNVVRKGRGY